MQPTQLHGWPVSGDFGPTSAAEELRRGGDIDPDAAAAPLSTVVGLATASTSGGDAD